MGRTASIRIPNNVFLIEKESDFPNYLPGSPTILNTGVYNLNAAIIATERFIIPDGEVVQLAGTDAFIGGIVYVGTGDTFTFSNILSFSLDGTFVTAPLSNSLYNCTNASTTFASVFIISTAIFDIPNFGGIENIAQFSGYFNAFTDIGIGMDLKSCDIVGFEQSQLTGWKNNVTSMITLDGTMTSFGMNGCPFTTDSNESIFDFKSTLNIKNGTVVGCGHDNSAGGDLFAAGSKDQTDINFNFQANSNMPDSQRFANMAIITPETVGMGTAGVPVIVNDTNTGGTNIWEALRSERFSINSSTGEIEYIGLEDTTVVVSVNSTLSSAGQDIIGTIINKNGVGIPESFRTTVNNNATSVVSTADVDLVTGDKLTLAVQNDSDISNITIESNFITND